MEKLNFSIAIAAPPDRVWFVLWNDYSYRQWTRAFHEGSYATSDWQQGSRIHFLSPGGMGMYAEIAEKTEPSRMVFRHIGEVRNFEEQPPDENWENALEAYTLEGTAEGTLLQVSVDTVEAYCVHLNEMFPKALALVKVLSEYFRITVHAMVQAPISKVWNYWTQPNHITHWNQASADWHTPRAENDLRVGGSFLQRMESKDGTMGFDFRGTYDVVENNSRIQYHMEDGRKVTITFEEKDGATLVTEAFEPEGTNSLELQRGGWQAILDSFKEYVQNY